MQLKNGVVLIGAGNLASSLGISLHRAGYRIEAIVGRSSGASRKRTRQLATKIGARPLMSLSKAVHAEVVWLCVPDAEIGSVAKSLVGKTDWKKRIAFHSSGALTSDELDPLRRRGAAVASVHPLMTFVRGSQPVMVGVPFAIEGDAIAVRAARSILADLGAQVYPIRKADKSVYHAWATFVSPLFTALLATAEQVAVAAGVPKREVRARAIPILLETLANYATLGAAGAFSGPIVRGDVSTVERHLRALRKIPEARAVYSALTQAAVRYLPVKNKSSLMRMLAAR